MTLKKKYALLMLNNHLLIIFKKIQEILWTFRHLKCILQKKIVKDKT